LAEVGGRRPYPFFLFVLYFNHKEVKAGLYDYAFENPSLAAEIGETIHHSPKTVFVAYHYGLPLEYYGEFAGAPWPVRIDDAFLRPPGEKERSVTERLDSIGFIPEYFVITNFNLYHGKHQDLQEYLEENCTIYEKQEEYLIYNVCNPIDRRTLDLSIHNH
jgi:hypothetical protein